MTPVQNNEVKINWMHTIRSYILSSFCLSCLFSSCNRVTFNFAIIAFLVKWVSRILCVVRLPWAVRVTVIIEIAVDVIALTAGEAASVPRFAERFLLLVEVNSLTTARTAWRSLVHFEIHLITLVRHTCTNNIIIIIIISQVKFPLEHWATSTLHSVRSPAQQILQKTWPPPTWHPSLADHLVACPHIASSYVCLLLIIIIIYLPKAQQ